MSKNKHVSWLEQAIDPEILESKLFKFRIHIDASKKYIEVDLTNDADIDYDRLEEELEDCPNKLVYWGTIYSALRAYGAILERKCKARRGVLMQEAARIIRDDNTYVKLSVEQTKMVIEKDETLNQLEELYIRVQMNTGKLYNMVQAIQMKAENMRSLFGMKKKEYDSGY